MTTKENTILDTLNQIEDAIWALDPQDRATLISAVNDNKPEFGQFMANQMELLGITPDEALTQQVTYNLRNKFRT